MVLTLTRGGSTMRVPLRLPATPAEELEAFERLDTISSNFRTTRVADVVSPIPDLASYIKNVYFDGSNYEKLKRLAQRLDQMTEVEQRIFSGALELESAGGLDDVLNIADSLDQYELFPKIATDEDLGRFLVDTSPMTGRFSFPEAVQPYLDYAKIGMEQRNTLGGVYTQYGLVRRQEKAPIQTDAPRTMLLTLTTSEQVCSLVLPASDEQMEAAKRALGVEDFSQAAISRAEYTAPYLERLIPLDCVSVEDANTLALCLRQMSPDELMTYRAALEVEDPAVFTEALNIAMDIDDYELVSGSEREYGREALRQMGANDELLDAIEGYTDLDRLGRDMMEEDGVRQTGCGMVRRLSAPFPPEQTIGQTMM